jgi:hypothetical protein
MLRRGDEARGEVPVLPGREAAVNERRQALDATTHSVGQTASPQAEAAMRIVVWATHGALQPAMTSNAPVCVAGFAATNRRHTPHGGAASGYSPVSEPNAA